MVHQVVYGADFIVSVKRNTHFNKEIKDGFYKTCQAFFINAAKSNWTAIDPPAQLGNVFCSIMSNLQDGQTATTLRQVAECLRDAAKCIEDAKWRPVEIILLLIPSQLETRVQSDEIQLKKREMLFSRISTKICILFNNPTLQKIPPLKRIFGHFTVLLKLFGRKMDEFHARHVTTADVVIREQFTNMLSMAINWLIHLNEEVDSLHPILNRT